MARIGAAGDASASRAKAPSACRIGGIISALVFAVCAIRAARRVLRGELGRHLADGFQRLLTDRLGDEIAELKPAA